MSKNPQWIVCAALFYAPDLVICGPRHFDFTMHGVLEKLGENAFGSPVQGFVDQYGVFLTREEAYVIAKRNGQIRAKTGNPSSVELFSEDLY